MRVQRYPFKWYQSYILGFLTVPLILLLFYASAIYINGVNENYYNIFCYDKNSDESN